MTSELPRSDDRPPSEAAPTQAPQEDQAAPVGALFVHDAVAQAVAIVVQDAAAYLRNVELVSAAVVAACATSMMESKETQPWAELIERANASVISASRVFAEVGENAGRVLKSFAK